MLLHDDVDKLLVYANELLIAAERETERSEEDVVTHLICTNARLSLANYLGGFLVQQEVAVAQPVTLQGLLDQCRGVDARFEEIDLTPIHCRCETHDNDYCMDMGQVKECMDLAQQVRAIVMKDTPGY